MLLRTLYAKLAVFLACLLIAMGMLYSLISLSVTNSHQSEVDQIFNRDLARNLVAERNLVEEGRINNTKLKETFHYFMMINPSIEIYLLDIEGKILSYSAEPEKVKRTHVSLEPINSFLENNRHPILGDDPRHPNRKKAFSVTLVPTAESPEGFLYVVLRGEQFDLIDQAAQGNYLIRLSIWTVIFTLLVGLLTGLYVFHLLTRRLQNLSKTMDAFRASGFNQHIAYQPIKTRFADEIDRLGINFNQMAKRIGNQLQELREKDNRRRELVAYVSHDLRTPLATLYGYLETLKIKGEELSDQERLEYLNIALKHGERLNRLVLDLFELAKLDAEQSPPQCEPFSPAELIQDVIQKFQLQADKQEIMLTTKFSNTTPMVSGEIGLIERVLENLIENALHHTPNKGAVTVAIQSNPGSVHISVSDTGCGINKEDIPRIFDRFFQAGNSHRGSGHSGLGLTISKRILELHNCEITVHSEPGVGTRFLFELPTVKDHIAADKARDLDQHDTVSQPR